MARVTVELGSDHLHDLVQSPIHGLAELLWNAVDADATRVDASAVRNGLGAIESICVRDNGHGMTEDEAARGFGILGESWKRAARRSRIDGRALHGRSGKGRYSAFGIGSIARWESVAEDDGERKKIIISGSLESPKEFDLVTTTPVVADTGTVVWVDGVTELAARQLDRPSVIDQLAASFALYLQSYPVAISWQGERVDPSALQDVRKTYDLKVQGLDDGCATLTVIEWRKPTRRAIYLCDADGMALHEVQPGIHAPGFEFTAYLRWRDVRGLGSAVFLADIGHEQLTPMLEAARDLLRTHFKQRIEAKRAEMVRRWKSERTYPYEGEPRTAVEAAARELFDIVAIAAARAIEAGDTQARKLSLRLIREALETNPSNLRRVLTDVMDLSAEQLDDLANLLERTSLPSIISGSRTVADRLAFLDGLDSILFDRELKKRTLERRQLHRILAGETWIFGEEYSLTGDDDRLLEVLRKHLAKLGEDVELAGSAPITRLDGTEGQPDLVLSKSIPFPDNRLEHLVVELKRPSVVIGRDELQQIEDYAYVVSVDERFNQPNVQWQFWIIGNELHPFVRDKADSPDTPQGVTAQGRRYRVIAKTWAEVITDAKHRLKFFQDALSLSSTKADGIGYLRQAHAKLLPDPLRLDVPLVKQRSAEDEPAGRPSRRRG